MQLQKKYSVFVSSTYEDLKDERQAVYSAILRLGSIPIGMEAFSASTVQQLDEIKLLIDHCDYFIVISAARYGSIHSDSQKSYTELEMEHAEQRGIPILRFVHSNIGMIPNKLHEGAQKGKDRLNSFHKKLRDAGYNCASFSSADDLGLSVATALTKAYEDTPRIGWTRGGTRQIDSSMLDGAWQLLPDVNRGRDQALMIKNGVKCLKFYSEKYYVGVWQEMETGNITFVHGGNYRRDGSKYVETCIFSNNANICPIGHCGEFELRLLDPYLDLTRSPNFSEHWCRAGEIQTMQSPATSTTAAPKPAGAL